MSNAQDTNHKRTTIFTNIKVVPIYHNSTIPCKNCECNLKNLLSSWNKKNIKNYQEIQPISYELVDTLKNDLDINYYFNKMANQHEYYLLYESDSKFLTIKKKEDMVSSGDKKAIKYLKDEIHKKLTINSTIYKIKVKLHNGKTFYDYAICDAATHQISFDDMFYYFWLVKED